MSIKLPAENIKCPYAWHEKRCRDLALDCPKFIRIEGKDPQSGHEVEEYGCSDTFIPMLLTENSKQQRATGAAVESFRNEMIKANQSSQQLLIASQRLVDGGKKEQCQHGIEEGEG